MNFYYPTNISLSMTAAEKLAAKRDIARNTLLLAVYEGDAGADDAARRGGVSQSRIDIAHATVKAQDEGSEALATWLGAAG